jgi:hypothetical protein
MLRGLTAVDDNWNGDSRFQPISDPSVRNMKAVGLKF